MQFVISSHRMYKKSMQWKQTQHTSIRVCRYVRRRVQHNFPIFFCSRLNKTKVSCEKGEQTERIRLRVPCRVLLLSFSLSWDQQQQLTQVQVGQAHATNAGKKKSKIFVDIFTESKHDKVWGRSGKKKTRKKSKRDKQKMQC